MEDNNTIKARYDIGIKDELPLVNVGNGNNLKFKSLDGVGYKVDFDPQTITEDKLPLEVPEDGDVKKIKVKGASAGKSFKLIIDKISKKNQKSKSKKVQVKPRMIIKVE
jgi:hypothetical protein